MSTGTIRRGTHHDHDNKLDRPRHLGFEKHNDASHQPESALTSLAENPFAVVTAR